MGAVGIGTATAVRVGHAVGRGDRRDMAYAGWTGLATALAYAGTLALVVALLPAPLARLFTEDAAVLAIAVPTLLVASISLVPDSAQGVLMGALRGAGDVWVPTVMHLCSFAVVMVPAAVLLALRFGVISRRGVARL
jgi:MATE family multidrug resistance protein